MPSVEPDDPTVVDGVVDTPQPLTDRDRLRLAHIRLGLLRELADRVDPITKAEKRVVMDLTDPGTTAKPTVDPTDRQDRTPFVTVTHAYGRQSLVYDDREFVPWVTAGYPSEVVTSVEVDTVALMMFTVDNGYDMDTDGHVLETIIAAIGQVTGLKVNRVVRPSFKTRLSDLFKTHGRIVGPAGELDIPGVTVHQGNPYVMVSHPNPDRLTELWAASTRTEIPRMLEEGTR